MSKSKGKRNTGFDLHKVLFVDVITLLPLIVLLFMRLIMRPMLRLVLRFPLMLSLRLVLRLALVLLLLVQGGCGPVIGFTADLLPKPSIPAQYDMRGKNVLIWIDDMAAGVNRPQLRHKLNDNLERVLQEHHAVNGVVNYSSISRFRQRNPDYTSMSIQQLGEEFHVDKVIYIFVNSFTFRHESGEGFYRVSLAGYIKVVDVKSGQRVWPDGEAYRSFDIVGQLKSGQGSLFESKLLDDFSRQAAERLALFFYTHKKQ